MTHHAQDYLNKIIRNDSSQKGVKWPTQSAGEKTQPRIISSKTFFQKWRWIPQGNKNKNKNKRDLIELTRFCIAKETIKNQQQRKDNLWNGRKYLQMMQQTRA